MGTDPVRLQSPDFHSPVLPPPTSWGAPGAASRGPQPSPQEASAPPDCTSLLPRLLGPVSSPVKGVTAPSLTSKGGWVSQMTPDLQGDKVQA